jgi:hypothetical protein
MKLNTIVLGSAGAGIAAIGATYLLAPNLLLNVYGFSLQSVSEANLFRGAYGGVFIAFALLVCAGVFKESVATPAQFALLTFMGGFALGRMASMAIDGMPHLLLVVIFVVEVAYALAAVHLLKHPSTN